MNMKQLLFFKQTAELENMTKAAEELMVSQPFLSRVLSELQAELGIKLFDRKGRNIVLNLCGKAFYKRVINIFNEIDDAVNEVRDLYEVQLTKISIVTNVSLYLPGLLKLIAGSNPDLSINQHSAENKKIKEMILSGSADFGICCPAIEPCHGLNSIGLYYETGVIIYPKGHWLEKMKEVDIDAIREEQIISVSSGYGTRAVLDNFIAQENMTPLKILIETTDTSSIFKYVENGIGIAFVPLSQLSGHPQFKNNFSRLKNNLRGQITLVWRNGLYINKTRELFIEKTKEYFSNI